MKYINTPRQIGKTTWIATKMSSECNSILLCFNEDVKKIFIKNNPQIDPKRIVNFNTYINTKGDILRGTEYYNCKRIYIDEISICLNYLFGGKEIIATDTTQSMEKNTN